MAHSEEEAIAEAQGRVSPATNDGGSEGEDGSEGALARPSGGLLGGMIKSDGAALASWTARGDKTREKEGSTVPGRDKTDQTSRCATWLSTWASRAESSSVSASRYFSASSAAMQPEPAEVIAWR